MKYTPENLRKMSDHAINLAVAEKIYPMHDISEQSVCDWEDCDDDSHLELEVFVGGRNPFSPCSDWYEAIEIAEKNKINVCFPEHGSSLSCAKGKDGCYAYISEHPNQRRAICEVFLMMG
jgi:hypothetical protein